MDFKPQTDSKTPFREPSPAISHLLKFACSPEKREKTVDVSIRIIREGNIQKSMIKDCYSYVSIVFDKFKEDF